MGVKKARSRRGSTTASTYNSNVLDLSAIIVLPTLNEEKYLSRTLESLQSQTVSCEVLVVDSNSFDKTRDIAKSYGCKVILSQHGKLNARHEGILQAKADVIVSCDADTIYPETWLENTIAAFKDDVIAVTGPRLYPHSVFHDAQRFFYEYCWRLFGSNSAFLRKYYFMSGGFNLSINQQDSKLMVDEEEVLFKERLAAFGRVLYQANNPVITSSRRFSNVDASYKKERAIGNRF